MIIVWSNPFLRNYRQSLTKAEGTKLRLDPPYWRKLRLGEKIPAARGESARARRVDPSLLKGFVFNKSADYALQGEVGT